jgi:predicted RNase H-like HicB family nuclease
MLSDIEKPQSMELYPYDIDGYEDEDENFVFTKFSFDGCCILGSSVEPAMENAKIEVQFTMSDFVKTIQSELNDKFTTFTKLVNENNNQGGIENMSNTDFTQTLLAQFEDISAMVRQQETFTDKWGYECPRYYTVDVQDNEVIVVDAMNNYNYFGLSFAMNGDKAEIDFESAKRKKLRYENYEESSSIEGAFDFGSHISEIQESAFAKVEAANTKISEAEDKIAEFETKVLEFETKVSEIETAKNEFEEKYNQINSEFEEMKPKYEEFVDAEKARIEAELDAQKDAEFAKYETVLTDNVEFEALKEKKAEMTVKEIESECAILYARKNLSQASFSRTDNGVITAGLVDNDGKDGFVISSRYGCIPVKK